MPKEPLTQVLIGVIGVLIVLVLVLLRRTAGTDRARLEQLAEVTARLGDGQAELGGRLAQLAEQSQASQSLVAERLQAQERQLSRQMEERLGELGRTLGATLEAGATRSATALADLRTRLALIDEAQRTITRLSSEVVGLQDILSNKQARGAFGQVQMEDLVSSTLPPMAYVFQATVNGTLRADCLLRLPNPPGPIVIDAKFPLESYRALSAARDETARTQAARAFAADVRRHVRDIAQKYIVAGETAESALMFLPSEAVYAELHASFANVVEESYRHRVWIVSPTTLMATLNTVRAVLKDVRMREQAGLIQKEVGLLLQDLARLDERVARLQRHFDQTSEDIRQIRISIDKLGKRGERIDELQLEEAEPERTRSGVLDTDHEGRAATVAGYGR